MKKSTVITIIVTVLITTILIVGVRNFLNKKNSDNKVFDINQVGGLRLVLEADGLDIESNDLEQALNSNILIIKERLKNHGIKFNKVRLNESKQIIIELPGLLDPPRLNNLITQPGLLEFKMVADFFKTKEIIDEIDKYFLGKFTDEIRAIGEKSHLQDLYESQLTTPFSEYIVSNDAIRPEFVDFMRPFTDSLFAKDKVLSNNLELALLKSDENSTSQGLKFLVLKHEAELTCADLKKVYLTLSYDDFSTTRFSKSPVINLELNLDETERFAKVTGNNVGSRLAIIIDDLIYSAPRIMDKINGGRAQITGTFSVEEAEDLVNILSSGPLKTSLRIVEENIILPPNESE